jgi:allantoin racemase
MWLLPQDGQRPTMPRPMAVPVDGTFHGGGLGRLLGCQRTEAIGGNFLAEGALCGIAQPILPRHIGLLAAGRQGAEDARMARILLINPNCSVACSAAIDAAVAPLRFAAGPVLDVVTVAEGPPAIYDWRDWHAVVAPVCRVIERDPADAYVVACASDPGIEAARAVTRRPVFGAFRSAVAAAVAQAERFGVIAIVEASKARHLAALRAMGLAARLTAEVALNVTLESLLEPDTARSALVAAGRELAARGAGAVVLGCTGMARHRAAIEDAACVPVIEPCQAAAALAVSAVLTAA